MEALVEPHLQRECEEGSTSLEETPLKQVLERTRRESGLPKLLGAHQSSGSQPSGRRPQGFWFW